MNKDIEIPSAQTTLKHDRPPSNNKTKVDAFLNKKKHSNRGYTKIDTKVYGEQNDKNCDLPTLKNKQNPLSSRNG